jgi:hypothetical protein
MGSAKQQPSADDSSPPSKGMTVTQQLQAKAALPELSRVQYAFWVCMAVLAQLNWGLYPVCTRYLQVRAPCSLEFSADGPATSWSVVLYVALFAQ